MNGGRLAMRDVLSAISSGCFVPGAIVAIVLRWAFPDRPPLMDIVLSAAMFSVVPLARVGDMAWRTMAWCLPVGLLLQPAPFPAIVAYISALFVLGGFLFARKFVHAFHDDLVVQLAAVSGIILVWASIIISYALW